METKERLKRAERIIEEIWDTFYGQNMSVTNWHLNGELEPVDNFFEDNDWTFNPIKDNSATGKEG